MKHEPYLWNRGGFFSFQIAVPRGLRGEFKSATGKPLGKIVEALGTDSLTEARKRREARLAEWTNRFERARLDTPLTLVEIAEKGQEAHDFLLDRLAADNARGRYDGAPIMGPDGEVELTHEEHTIGAHFDAIREALAEDYWSAVRAEVQAVARRKGVAIESGSPTYARLAKAIVTEQARAMGNHLRLRE